MNDRNKNQDIVNKQKPILDNSSASQKKDDESVDSFLTEIESDLRDEQIQKFWKIYKNWFYGSLVFLVLSVAGYQAWQGVRQERFEEQSVVYDSAKSDAIGGDSESALRKLSLVSKKGGNYGALADLQRAALLLDQGRKPEALEIYRLLLEKNNISRAFKDLSALLLAMNGIGVEETDYLESLINPLMDPGNAFSYNAMEIKSLIALKSGELVEASEIVRGLINDSGTPQTVRGRAQELLEVFESGYSIENIEDSESFLGSQVDFPSDKSGLN